MATKSKKMVLSLLASASLLTLIVPSTYAAEPVAETSTYAVSSVVVTTNYTEEDMDPIVSPFSLLTNYSFGPLSVNDFTTTAWFNHYSYGNITVKLAQYPSYGSGTVSIEYILRASEKNSIPIAGNYSSATKTITFDNVQAGTYALEIKNIGELQLLVDMDQSMIK
ncbi:hypothetical protein J2Z22_000809 [Paenibacillus forsythiae]|uniref:Uncharacterized protein n=1 Tax=Paenibacillus forsythiae TaxID=365616 RepID=A0ABU3H396_9BACL|nr:hypothetical protein [Paenibacillus forsythiae]MDT3425293.1 hypothetical protein [Paenibacillus forsythiae]